MPPARLICLLFKDHITQLQEIDRLHCYRFRRRTGVEFCLRTIFIDQRRRREDHHALRHELLQGRCCLISVHPERFGPLKHKMTRFISKDAGMGYQFDVGYPSIGCFFRIPQRWK